MSFVKTARNLLLLLLPLAVQLSCRKDKASFPEGNYNITLDDAFTHSLVFAAGDGRQIYLGSGYTAADLNDSLSIWHVEKAGGYYIISPAAFPTKVLTYEGNVDIIPMLEDRPTAITNDELFAIEKSPVSENKFQIRFLRNNGLFQTTVIYQNRLPWSYGLTYAKRGDCSYSLSNGGDTAICTADFTFTRR